MRIFLDRFNRIFGMISVWRRKNRRTGLHFGGNRGILSIMNREWTEWVAIRRRSAASILIALFLFPVSAGLSFAGEDPPPTMALLLSAPPSMRTGNALLLLLERRLDQCGVLFHPASIPEGTRDNLASLLETEGDFTMHETGGAYVRSEAREFGVEVILLLRLSMEGSRVRPRLMGIRAPFVSSWSIVGEAVSPLSIARAVAALADSAAASLGGALAPQTEPILYDLEAEESYAQGRKFGSIQLLDKAIAFDSTHAPARSDLGFRLSLRENRIRGLRLLESVPPSDLPESLRKIHRARLAYARHERRKFRAAIDILSASLPARYETLLLSGLGLMEEGDMEKAKDMLVRAVRTAPFDPLPHRLLGDAALRTGFLDLARSEYRKALSLAPRDFLSRIGVASVYYSEGLLTEAGDILSLPPPPDPHGLEGTRPHFAFLAARAGFLLARGLFREAAADLEAARDRAYELADEESLLDLTIRLFRIHLEGGDLDRAEAEISLLRFRRESDSFTAERPGSFVFLEGLLGAYRQDMGTFAAKRLELETLAGADPVFIDLLNGYYHLMRNQGMDAEPYLRTALHREENSLGHHLLGRAARLSRKWPTATRELEWVVNRGESLLDIPQLLPLSFYYLGVTLEESGDTGRAQRAYLEFLHYWERASGEREEIIRARRFLSYR